jgi:UDP-N-acetylglucosamine 2-epimerase (non-hydrolysing)
MKNLVLVAGARPNFVKVAPVLRALRAHAGLRATFVHTGQHYDDALSESFFRTLDIRAPDVNLEVGSASHAVQTARIMERFEPVLTGDRPTAVVVFGDVNSTAACALVASKLVIPVVHVEAGLRSRDRSMPEEVNRIVTDALSDLLFASEPSGAVNLRAEGHPEHAIVEVGNVMIDSLEWIRPRAEAAAPWRAHGLDRKGYGLVTLHRPSNVDDLDVFARVVGALNEIAAELPLLFPVHPRTRGQVERVKLHPGIRVIAPVDYIESIALQGGARVVLTDSGGIQEEASCLNTPCLTLRPATERPITAELGSSTLVGNDPNAILAAYAEVRRGTYRQSQPIPLWDGHAAERVATVLEERYG